MKSLKSTFTEKLLTQECTIAGGNNSFEAQSLVRMVLCENIILQIEAKSQSHVTIFRSNYATF